MLRFLCVYIPHLSRHRSSSNSSTFAALCATDVRGFESPLGIDRSRDCCRYHDSYPYSPSALWTLFALKVKVRTDCATRQTPKFCRISLAVGSKIEHLPAYSRMRWLPPDNRCSYRWIPTDCYVSYQHIVERRRSHG